MSWDISLRTYDNVSVRNVTYNNSKLFEAAGIDFDEMEDKRAGTLRLDIMNAIEYLSDGRNQDAIKSLEPENGWCGRVDCINFLIVLLKKCEEYPDHRFHAS